MFKKKVLIIAAILVTSNVAHTQTWGNGNSYADFQPEQYPFGIWDPTNNYTYVLGLKDDGINVVRDGHDFTGFVVDFDALNDETGTPTILRIFNASRFIQYVRCRGLHDNFMPNFTGNQHLNFEKNLYLRPDNPTVDSGFPTGGWCNTARGGPYTCSGSYPLEFGCYIFSARFWTNCVDTGVPSPTLQSFNCGTFANYKNNLAEDDVANGIPNDDEERHSIFRWYILDEPHWPAASFPNPNANPEFKLVDGLSANYFHGRLMTAVPISEPVLPEDETQPNIYQDFVDNAPNIKELVLDIYPYIDTLPTSGTAFQQQLNDMNTVIDYAKTAAMSRPMDFWVIAQAFENTNNPNIATGKKYRMPSAPELRTQSYLAMAHGANALLYYYMKNRNGTSWTEFGMESEPTLRTEVARIGRELNVDFYPGLSPSRTLGNWLNTLEFVDAFPTHTPNGATNLPQSVQVNSTLWLEINGISKNPSNIGPYTEIGVFRDGNYPNNIIYLFVVDRNPAQASGGNTVTIFVDWNERNISGQITTSGTTPATVLIGGGGLERKYNLFKQGASNQETQSIPTTFQLKQNYPNPFNPGTVISYDIAKSEFVEITLYDISGREVKKLVNKIQEPGQHEVTWGGLDNTGNKVSTGIYIVKMRAGKFIAQKKISLIK